MAELPPRAAPSLPLQPLTRLKKSQVLPMK
jgi:hypothetical protein